MILDVFINESNIEFDYFNFINEMNDISEDLIIESHEIIKETENAHNKLFTMNLLEDYNSLKGEIDSEEPIYIDGHEIGTHVEYKKQSKYDSAKKDTIKKSLGNSTLINRLIDTIHKWFVNICEFIDKFFEKIFQKINGIDKLKKLKNPVYKASEEITELSIDSISYIYDEFGMDGDWNFIDGFKEENLIDKMKGLADRDDLDDLDFNTEKALKDLTDSSETAINSKDIADKISTNHLATIKYKTDGSNAPELSELIKFIDDYSKAKNEIKRMKNYLKVINDNAIKAINNNLKAVDNEKFKKAYQKMSTINTKVNMYNQAVAGASLILLKKARMASVRLAKNYKESNK